MKYYSAFEKNVILPFVTVPVAQMVKRLPAMWETQV